MTELHLIGTLTQDPDGPERLAGLLREVRPDQVAVEVSRRAFEHQRARGGAARAEALAVLRQRGADAATVDFWGRRLDPARLHFEPFTAAAYAAGDGLPLHFLGDDEGDGPGGGPGGPPVGEEDGAGGAEDFRQADPEALAALAGHDWAASYRADYARARADLEAKACLEFLIPVEAQPAYKARDEAICGRLRALLDGAGDEGARRGEPARLAVVCDLTHLYFSEARLTIYSQLYEATTRRYVVDGKGAVRDHPIVLPWKMAAS
ncbi:MAG TPA: hypothetical protein VH257_04500 [Chloroflexota bacterium]|nr:hypothetical protein [Chloroflexota bacterium]